MHEDRRGVVQPLDVVGRGGTPPGPRGRVGVDALEHARAVVQGVGEDVDLRRRPRRRARRPSRSSSVFSMGIPTTLSLADRRSPISDCRCSDHVVGRGDGLPDPGGRLGLAEELEHHRRRDDRGPGIGRAGARDVGRRAVDRLEQRRARPGRVEVRRGGPPDPAGDGAAEVGEDVAEEVVGDDHVVPAGVLHEVDARGVDVVVAGRDVGVLGGDLVEGALPEIAGEREHVRLVHEREVTGGRRDRARSNAKRTHRSTPKRVLTDPWVATSWGVPLRRNPPSPA